MNPLTKKQFEALCFQNKCEGRYSGSIGMMHVHGPDMANVKRLLAIPTLFAKQ